MSKTLSGRRLPVFLLLSLMVNMLLVGILAGQFLAERERGGARLAGPPPAEARLVRSLLQTLDAPDRAELRRAFGEVLRGNRDLIRERRQARRDMAAALGADPFRADELRAAFARMRTADAALQQSVQSALADQMAQLSPHQRRALSDLLSERFDRHHRGGGRRRGPRPTE